MAVAMLGISLPAASAQSQSHPLQYNHSAGIVTLSTDDLTIKVVGVNDQPHFHWWSTTNPDIDYHMRFLSIFEVEDVNENGIYDQGVDTVVGPKFTLPTTDWEFSGFETEIEDGNITAVHFNFTSVSDVYVQILVHIDMNNPSEIKFDLVIDGWTWTRDDSLLVFQFVITESNHGSSGSEDAPQYFHKTETKFEFSNGYMEYEPTALAAQNQLNVSASYGEGTGLHAGESVFLAFPYFGNETLFYDPILGINSDSSTSLLDTPTLYLVGGVVGVVAIAAIVLKIRK